MRISFVVAYDRRGLIGKDNALPWRIPADMRHVRALTVGKPLIMGRRTFESIGRALPERTSIVLTRDPSFAAKDVLVARTPEEALALAAGAEEAIVFGGAEIFRLFMPLADRMYVTEIDAEFEGDTFFPKFDRAEWQEVERREHAPDEKDPYRYAFVTLDRRGRPDVPEAHGAR